VKAYPEAVEANPGALEAHLGILKLKQRIADLTLEL
jgi:hypothetical protein